MATSTSKNQPPKPRKRIDVASPSILTLKRGSNGSAFVHCDSCNKDVPAATADMHACLQDSKTKAVLGAGKPVVIDVEQVVPSKETNQVQEKISQKRTTNGGDETSKKPKKMHREKDPNKPKRPPTAFFLFMDEFRKTYKEANPDSKGVAAVAKEGGDKWKSMSDEEKSAFVQKALELKEEYAKALEAYESGTKGIANESE